MKSDLSKLTGEELFGYYTSQGNKYRQVLFQVYLQIGDKLFKMLEKAEKEGKKIVIKESLQDVDDLPITTYIE